MRFDQIEDAVLRGDADCGVLIHEGRFTYQSKGLTLLTDLGVVWEERMRCPLPLAAIAIRRDLAHLAPDIDAALKASVEYAFAHPDASREYVAAHAQEMDPDVTRRHIQLYVNDYTRALDEQAVLRMSSGAKERASSRRPANRSPSSADERSQSFTLRPSMASSYAGRSFGRYRLIASLGAGGMGEVYRARDERLERDVAIKVIRRGDNDEDRSRRLKREANILSKLDQPNIAAVYDSIAKAMSTTW